MSERALELAIALEAELAAQYDKLAAVMLRPEYSNFPLDERSNIQRKQSEICELYLEMDVIKYQISRL